jgi:hypothetical protein
VYWQAAAWALERKARTRGLFPRPVGAFRGGAEADNADPTDEIQTAALRQWEAYLQGVRDGEGASRARDTPDDAAALPEGG